MTEHSDEHDDVIEPVRPRRISPAEAIPVQQSSRGRLRVGIAAAVLLLGLFFVVVLLPSWVAKQPKQQQQTPDPQPAAANAPAAPALDEAAVAVLRDQAEVLLTRMVTQEGQLKDLQPEFWAATAWQDYLDSLRSGDDSFIAQDYQAAIEHYRQGLEQGEALQALSATTLQDALEAATVALTAGDEVAARENFELAMRIDPDNSLAIEGLARVERLPEVLAAMNKARSADAVGNVEAAVAAYSEVLASDPLWQPAIEGLAAARRKLAGYRFERAMTAGLSALDDSDFDTAEAAFKRALAIRQGAPEALDGLERTDQGRRLNRINLARIRAAAFEQQERWAEATEQYEAALALDDTLVFAQQGMLRSRGRADLAKKLALLIDRPTRLFDASVLRDARLLLVSGETAPAPRAKLAEELETLAGYIEQAATPINITLLSDGLTEVTVFRVGRIGNFERHDLELRPGDYTAIGSRNGFRDVRAQFRLRPGKQPQPVLVRCIEPI